MTLLNCIESSKDKDNNLYGCFLIEPLETGQGITLGNALRRTLLSDLTGFSITGVRLNNLKHEFSIVEGVREDILEILLNLKQIIFKVSFHEEPKNQKLKGYLNVKGPLIITAGMFFLPKNKIKIINPNQYICTIVDESEFHLEIDIEKGIGYKLTEENIKKKCEEKLFQSKPTTLLIDAVFIPIKKVNYKIKLIHDTKGNIKESLCLEVTTNGSLTPKRAINEALKILLSLFYPLLVNSQFLKLSHELGNKIEKINK
jgi:DNA-directed RNA polymerase subunit alpha